MLKQRGARMSKMQQEVYIKFLENNPNFSTGTNSFSYDFSTREKDFDRLVALLNGTPGAVKDRKHWQETLADWRSKLLKRYRYHYSEEVRNSMSTSAVRNLKKFDDFDVRALKALGKWENDHGGARKVLNNTQRKLRSVSYQQDSESNHMDEYEEADEDGDESSDFYNLIGSSVNEPFSCLNVKTEVEVEDPLVEEVPVAAIEPPLMEHQALPAHVNNRKRRRRPAVEIEADEYEEQPAEAATDVTMTYERVLLENTKAMRQHTTAILGLTDALNTLTSTIRTYMYNK